MNIRKTLYLLLSCAMLSVIAACGNYTNYRHEGDGNSPTRSGYERRISRRSIARRPARPRQVTRGIQPGTDPSLTDPIMPQVVKPRPYGQMIPPVSQTRSPGMDSSDLRGPGVPHDYRSAAPTDIVPYVAPDINILPVVPHVAVPPSRMVQPTSAPAPQKDAANPAANNPVADSNTTPQNPQPVATKRELASHKTEFNAKEQARNTNITRASNSINGHVVQPGGTFSYNETVGPTIERRGYKEGTIYVQGEKKKGFGGGVCQVSSTLSVAAEEAGMKIIERHDHSLPVTYAKEGEEAATSYGGIDFKFKNEKPFPVVIRSSVEGGTITVAICEA